MNAPMTDRRKAALIRMQKLLRALGQKLDRDGTRRIFSSHDDLSSAPSFAEMADEVAELIGPSAKA